MTNQGSKGQGYVSESRCWSPFVPPLVGLPGRSPSSIKAFCAAGGCDQGNRRQGLPFGETGRSQIDD